MNSANYVFHEGVLFKKEKNVPVANFLLVIASHAPLVANGRPTNRYLDLAVIQPGRDIVRFSCSSNEFCSGSALERRILEVAGPSAVVYEGGKELRKAAQEFSGFLAPERLVTMDLGFDPDGTSYRSRGLLITSRGVEAQDEPLVDLFGTGPAQGLGFHVPQRDTLLPLARHLVDDFLNLQRPEIMFPLAGHLVLAGLTSQIGRFSGLQKPALHLVGPSGGGKSFVARLAQSFFGSFEDRFMCWAATPNSIEAEGHLFRDALFLIDDFKPGLTPVKDLLRILQGHADGHGRSRLSAQGERQPTMHIRGLILSTGEGFPVQVESVLTRTIVIPVDGAGRNTVAGERCLKWRRHYPTFLAGMIQVVLREPRWQESFRDVVQESVKQYSEHTGHLASGLRIAGNWALNRLGFNLFCGYLVGLGVLTFDQLDEMLEKYDQIAAEHMRAQARSLLEQNPVALCFHVLGQLLATGMIHIHPENGEASRRGTVVAYERTHEDARVVFLIPDIVMRELRRHFSGIGEKLSFNKNTLRDAMARDGLIQVNTKGRWTHQFRGPQGKRFQGWRIDAGAFDELCGAAHDG